MGSGTTPKMKPGYGPANTLYKVHRVELDWTGINDELCNCEIVHIISFVNHVCLIQNFMSLELKLNYNV